MILKGRLLSVQHLSPLLVKAVCRQVRWSWSIRSKMLFFKYNKGNETKNKADKQKQTRGPELRLQIFTIFLDYQQNMSPTRMKYYPLHILHLLPTYIHVHIYIYLYLSVLCTHVHVDATICYTPFLAYKTSLASISCFVPTISSLKALEISNESRPKCG